jgi:hypothetical protein
MQTLLHTFDTMSAVIFVSAFYLFFYLIHTRIFRGARTLADTEWYTLLQHHKVIRYGTPHGCTTCSYLGDPANHIRIMYSAGSAGEREMIRLSCDYTNSITYAFTLQGQLVGIEHEDIWHYVRYTDLSLETVQSIRGIRTMVRTALDIETLW